MSHAAQPARPVVLALDTSTPVLSAAVSSAGAIYDKAIDAGRHTGALVPQVVAEVMANAGVARAELTAVAVGVGPGPYTSLRAGIMFAEAAAAVLQIPVLGACSLDVTAAGHVVSGMASGEFVVASDARRRELYWAHYTADGRRINGPQVDPRVEVERRWCDDGINVVTAPPSAGQLARWVVEECLRSGGAVLPLSATPEQWAAPTQDGTEVQIPQTLLVPRPLYLRRPDAAEPRQVTPPAPGVPR